MGIRFVIAPSKYASFNRTPAMTNLRDHLRVLLIAASVFPVFACNSGSQRQVASDSARMPRAKHVVVLRPKKIDPYAEKTGLADTVSGLTSLPPSEQSNGWKLLFNGKDLSGWKGFNTDTIGKAWKVSAGVLHLDLSDRDQWKTNQGGDLCTIQNFKDFDLSMDYRTYPSTNSGVLIRVQEGPSWPKPYDSGVEMQILDDSANPDKTVLNHRSGSMFGIYAAPSVKAKGPGEWNHLLISSRKNEIIYMLNGRRAVRVAIGSKIWKDSLAHSKFSKQAGFATSATGKIDLQEHGGSVDFKNIKIKTVS